jgi:uncharacterized LabA/DUF88 family protein
MDRCAVFVDAGWFLAEAAQALTGKGVRSAVECDYAKVTAALGQLTSQTTQLPLLRIYWYDAAPDGVPGPDHLEIARLANVKLRLGRISHHQQKGVDALLILDLTTLARERAIASALVVSGDEDIREGIATAQSLGVHVTLAALAMQEGRPSQATTLVHEADEQLVVDATFLRRYITAHAPEPELVTAPLVRPNGVTSPREFGLAFGSAYADRLNDAELRSLQRDAPTLPADVAAQLFREAEQTFGEPLRGKMEIRRELRMGFWDHVMQRR